MIILINSGYHFVGVSTLSYMLARNYASLMNQKTLLVSLGSSLFYKSATALDKTWEPQSIKNILNKVHGRDSVDPYFYKMDNNLYYYYAVNSTLRTMEGQRDLQVFFSKIRKEYQTIYIDIDSEIYGYVKLAQIADKILIVVPPDIKAIELTGETVNKTILEYTQTHGVKLKADLFYVMQRYDKTISLSRIYKLLNVSARSFNEIGYSRTLAKERNNSKLDFYVNDLLTIKMSMEDIVLATNLKKLLRKLGERV